MKDISEVLRELEGRYDGRNEGADIYVVVDDHKTHDEPVVHRQLLSESQLARNNDPSLAELCLESGLKSAFTTWRDNR